MKKLISMLLALLMLIMLSSCGNFDDTVDNGIDVTTVDTPENTPEIDKNATTWAIYWYLCGSDLETDLGSATEDLNEMMQVYLPENVSVVIQTGGANEWQNDTMSAEYSQRFLYSGDELTVLENNQPQNMGDAQTLADFLEFCTTNYPADRQSLIFWNHGGGSLGGIAFDEQFDSDSLSLTEIYAAFDQIYDFANQEDAAPPFEMIGFDACLMATLETAGMLHGIANYMVASQESESSIGWDYRFLSELGNTDVVDGKVLGTIICDTYQASCIEQEVGDDVTLSVVDLQKAERLFASYHNVGVEALTYASEDSSFYASYSRGAKSSENYGGNSESEGFTNMVDLGDLMENAKGVLPENSSAVISALHECIVYKVAGPLRSHSNGLSCYFPYDGDQEGVEEFAKASLSASHTVLYDYGVTGYMSDDDLQYINEMEYIETTDSPVQQAIPQISTAPQIPSVVTLELEDFPVSFEEGYAVLHLGSEIAQYLSGVYCNLYYMSAEDDMLIMLGRDNNLASDWETGVFQDNFSGTWGSIDGHLVYMEITYEGDEYNLYSVPIMLNDQEYNLRVSYSYTEEEYSILGAKKGLDDNGMSDRNLVQLKPGDKITTLHYMSTISEEEDSFTMVEVEEIIVTENTRFYDEEMEDGDFLYMFEMVDSLNKSMYSEVISIVIKDQEIILESIADE